MTDVGYGTSGSQYNRPDPYMEQWMVGVQYALTKNDLIDVSYVGSHGVKLAQGSLNFNQLPTADLSQGNQLLQQVTNPYYGKITGSGCGLSSPTVALGQLLLPYPEFCSVSMAQPLGSFSHYNALEMSFTHRWSSGLSLLASYTYSRFTDNTVGTTSWLGQTPIRDNYNLAAEKSLDAADTPNSLVVTYIYELPIGKGKKAGMNMNPVANAIVGGWQIAGVTTFKSGFPIAITTGDNNTNSFGGNQRPNLVGDPTLSNPTIQKWFNTAAFKQPDAVHFRQRAALHGQCSGPWHGTIRHRCAEVVQVHRDPEDPVPCRDVQRVQPGELLRARRQPYGLVVWSDLRYDASARYPVRTKIVLVSARLSHNCPGGFDSGCCTAGSGRQV
jgi:hypothetical protein